MAKKLTWNNSANQFQREIGNIQGKKSSPRFYLGCIKNNAIANCQRLESLWKAVKDRQNNNEKNIDSSESPSWNVETHAMASAIAKGSWSVLLTPPILDDLEEMSKWHKGLCKWFPMIQVEVEEKYKHLIDSGTKSLIEKLHGVKEREDIRHQTKINEIKRITNIFGGKIHTKETLFEAINAFITEIKTEKKGNDEKPNESAMEESKRATRIINHTQDVPLSEFDNNKIYEIIKFWEKRPKSSLGKMFSYNTCTNTLTFFKKFLRWLNKSPAFPWKKPNDLEIEKISVEFYTEEFKNMDFYTEDEFKILWDFATVFERKMMLIAVNCGFGANDIAKLTWENVFDKTIKGIRPKTRVYGEFMLWDITEKAMGKRKKEGFVFTTKNGKCLTGTTKKGNRIMTIPNAWNRLFDRISKKHKDFKYLSFHNVRKSSANIIRKIADGETASVFLRHGEPVKKRKEVETYTTPAFEKVFEAQKILWSKFETIFTDIENVNTSKKLTLQQVKEIQKLKKEGITSAFLAKKYLVTPNTVRKICRKPKETSL